MRALALAAPLLFAGCSLVLDPSRHQGGDGGADPCDVDRDGFPSISCQGGTDCDDHDATRYPGAPAICGDGVANACAGSFPFTSSQLFGGLGDLGTIPATTLRDGGTLGEGVALAAVRVGGSGYGTAGVYTLDLRGDTVLHPLRIDVPLDAPATATIGTLLDYAGTVDYSMTKPATSVDARARSAGVSGRIGVQYVDSATGLVLAGVIDTAGVTSSFEAYASPLPVLDEPGVQDGSFLTRQLDTGNGEVFVRNYDGPALPPSYVTGNVPSVGGIRLVTTTSSFFAMANGSGTVWFAQARGATTATTRSLLGQMGKVAWAAGTTNHVLGYRVGSNVVFEPYGCPGSGSDVCYTNTGTVEPASASAPGGDVFDGLALSDRTFAFLYSRGFDDGVELVLQLVQKESLGFASAPYVVASLRGTADRFVDARMDIAVGPNADSLAIAYLVAIPTTAPGRSDRLVLTGLRSCTAY